MFNIYGNVILGGVDVSWNYVRVPDDCGGETVIPTRTDSKSYYIKDHLGNIRQTIKETGTFSSARDYYPYGETLRAYVAGSANDKYQFTGKERDKETNFDCFGARYYACPVKGGDSEFARWNSVDPMSGKYPGWSSYNYCMGNPIRNYDPDGKFVLNGDFQAKYPKFTEYVKNVSSLVNNSKIVDGLIKYGQFTKENIPNVLSWGKGPSINIEALEGAYGEYYPGKKTNEIKVNEKYVKLLESASGTELENLRYLLVVVLLHELVHYGDDQDGQDYPGEEGNLFETDVFGQIINLSNASQSKKIFESTQKNVDDSHSEGCNSFKDSIQSNWDSFWSPAAR